MPSPAAVEERVAAVVEETRPPVSPVPVALVLLALILLVWIVAWLPY